MVSLGLSLRASTTAAFASSIAICHRVGRREICVRVKSPISRVDGAVAFIDRIIEMSETYVGCGQHVLTKDPSSDREG